MQSSGDVPYDMTCKPDHTGKRTMLKSCYLALQCSSCICAVLVIYFIVGIVLFLQPSGNIRDAKVSLSGMSQSVQVQASPEGAFEDPFGRETVSVCQL